MAVNLTKDPDRVVQTGMRRTLTPGRPNYSTELRGAHARHTHGPSFARAFVAGLRQGGDTAPLALR